MVLVLFGANVSGQNQYGQSQYMHHHAFVNPGAVASYKDFSAALFYRNQWAGFSGSPVTQGLSIANPLKSGNAGWGAQILRDKIGVNDAVQFAGTYAYNVTLSEKMKLGLGLSGVLNLAQGRFGSVETIVPNDPVYQANTPMQIMPNFRFGSYLYGDDYYAGIAIPALMKNQIEFTGDGFSGSTSIDAKDMHFYLMGGYEMFVSDELYFMPSTLVKMVSGSPIQIDLNANFMYQNQVGFGLSYRTGGTMVLMANYLIDSQFMIGYSYDAGFSNLASYAGGAHEIMVRFEVRSAKNREKEEEPEGKTRVKI